MKNKKNKNTKEYSDAMEMCRWILKQRTMYPMKRIEYAIDYVKDKLIDENGVIKVIDEDSYETLLQEGATFLLRMSQEQLKDMLIESNLLYWAAGQNIISIRRENSNQRRFDEGWHPFPFLAFRIFLLFEVCVRLKREGRCFIELPKYMTFEQVYEKGVKELQVQLTTYWDYITTDELKRKCSDLIDDWSCNVVNRLMNLKLMALNSCCEMNLVVGHEGHCIYLSLCKASNYILMRLDNRWMDTVPLNTSHPKNGALIQPYLVAYFQLNSLNIEKNKEWLKKYIRDATILEDSNGNESMTHLYCNGNNNPPREENEPSIVKDWPYRPIQTNAQNCCLRSHNVGYRIRLEYKSVVFKKRNFNAILNSNNVPPSELMKVLSKQLKAEFDEVNNGIAVKQALVAKANIS
ncbi:hypothetical protein RFI_34638, partial [Reticulomyxa filosa]